MSDISSIPPTSQPVISFADLRAKFSQQATVQVFEDGTPSDLSDDNIFPIFLPYRFVWIFYIKDNPFGSWVHQSENVLYLHLKINKAVHGNE